MNERIRKELNEQIQAEFYSAYLYLSMAAFCESINLKGFAHWMCVQAKEETTHAMKIYDHLIDRGVVVKLMPIEGPPTTFESPLVVFEKVLEHEQKVSQRIHKIYEIALKDNDHAAAIMLQWFITEQVEEEAQATAIVEKLKMVGEKSRAGLLYIDKELGKRE